MVMCSIHKQVSYCYNISYCNTTALTYCMSAEAAAWGTCNTNSKPNWSQPLIVLKLNSVKCAALWS